MNSLKNFFKMYKVEQQIFFRSADVIITGGSKNAGEIRESYIDGVWNKDDESEWLTEIQIPIEKA